MLLITCEQTVLLLIVIRGSSGRSRKMMRLSSSISFRPICRQFW